jgi:hypothetical protein
MGVFDIVAAPFKAAGKAIGGVAKIAAPIAGFIPGVGPLAGAALGGLGSLLGGGDAQAALQAGGMSGLTALLMQEQAKQREAQEAQINARNEILTGELNRAHDIFASKEGLRSGGMQSVLDFLGRGGKSAAEGGSIFQLGATPGDLGLGSVGAVAEEPSGPAIAPSAGGGGSFQRPDMPIGLAPRPGGGTVGGEDLGDYIRAASGQRFEKDPDIDIQTGERVAPGSRGTVGTHKTLIDLFRSPATRAREDQLARTRRSREVEEPNLRESLKRRMTQ